jgi:hypothetical protein
LKDEAAKLQPKMVIRRLFPGVHLDATTLEQKHEHLTVGTSPLGIYKSLLTELSLIPVVNSGRI